MPTAVTIRNVPDDVRDELAARAARSGRSLQEYLRAELIRLAGSVSVDDWLASAREVREAAGFRLTAEEIVAMIHEGRP
jgi:plasmid stability protein